MVAAAAATTTSPRRPAMAARNSSGVGRRRARVDGNRPQSSGRKATKPRPSSPARADADGKEPTEALSQLSTAIALVEMISLAMRTHEDEPHLGSIAESLEVACCQLVRAYSEIDLAL